MKNLMFISILITINISVFAQLKFADKETLASFFKDKNLYRIRRCHVFRFQQCH
jgi:hypothetical protein